MANLTESSVYESGVPQLETTTQARGGPGGVMNAQAQALANRTKFLKDVLDSPTELDKTGGVQIGFEHSCFHPMQPYATIIGNEIKPKYEGGYNKIFIKMSTK